MKSQEVREEFLSFFEGKGHQRVPSSSVVPFDDPTLYFTNAGMNQFKDVFLGLGSRDFTRAVDTQKCMRVSGKHNDLEEVGISPWHHTLFEMLGNWSFGDYFKEEAIVWGWELVTERYGLEKERLWATVFGGDESLDADEEAERLWEQCTDLLPGHVVRLPAKENFWEMGETGPCGVCSEIHYYVGDDLSAQSNDMLVNDTGDMVEIWNLVFIQYNREKGGLLSPLPSQHVDTGMGFERMCSVLQGVKSNYETDVFTPLISEISALSGKEYAGAFRTPIQVIADHIRALSLTIADGALPSNEGRGYVLRRILRRAARYARQLDQNEPFIHRLVGVVSEDLGLIFPEIKEKKTHVELVIRAEEEGFGKTLDRGLEIFERFSENGIVTGDEAFQLYDTYGFPRDLTELMARERGVTFVEPEGFLEALDAQRKRARAATKDHFNATESVGMAIEGSHSTFVGYGELEVESEVVFSSAGDDHQIEVFVKQTPFYAESGGQLADKGFIEGADFSLEVLDVRKARGGIAHIGRLVSGEIGAVNGSVTLRVENEIRQASCRNHTATHLLHEALRQVLGDHVGQMGSLVSSERLRFDFSHFSPIESECISAVAAMVNEQIRADLEVVICEEELETARSKGAKALFGEKYGDRVRVVQIGDYSVELCGGTHVVSTGQIGFFDLISETGIAAGTRRAEALTGKGAEVALYRERDLLMRAAAKANVPAEDLPERIDDLLQRQRHLERSSHEMQRRLAALEADDLSSGAEEVEGVVVVARRVQVDSIPALRAMADSLREKMDTGIGVLAAEIDGKGALIAVVTDDLVKQRRANAGQIVRSVAQLTGGSGGGKPHLAQAGARNVGAIDSALSEVAGIVKEALIKA
ncbi:MAG: alanine--tRNA ligase [Candidatus Latescibacterota bacterium]|nr:alanine--tRNA ligase [Candidatus Latescibacterota bacterium]